MRKFSKTLLLSAFVLSYSLCRAQDQSLDSALLDRVNELEKTVKNNKPGEEHFLLAGLATFGFAANHTTTEWNGVKSSVKTNSLADADHFEFSPMLLWRHGDKVLLEFEPSFSNGEVGVNWADVSYFVTNGVILRAGYIVLPFGVYNKRLAAGWIDKLATDPVGLADVPPTSDYGIEVEGGLQAGTMKWNYDVALSNGLQLLSDGTLQSAGIVDNNNNKTITGRIGWLPLSNSSLELGASLMAGKVGDLNASNQDAKAFMYAFDLNLIENLKPLQLNIKGQYNVINVNHQDYINPEDSSSVYSFDNHTTTGFIQASLRPVFSQNKFIKNLEVAGRYGNFTTPENSTWGGRSNSYSIGLDYWLSWRMLVKFTYESIRTTNTSGKDLGGTPGAITKSNTMFLQFAIQL